MYYLTGIIREALKKLNSEEEREFLRNLKSGAVKEIEEEFLNNLLELEYETAKNTMGENLDYTIYNVPVNYNEYIEIDEMFFPVYEEDPGKYSEINKTRILDEENREIKIKQIYLDVEYHRLEKFQEKCFNARLNLQGEIHNFIVSVKHVKKYLEKEKEILRVFNLNRINWKVQNNLYSRRFFELYIEDLPKEIGYKELEKIEIDYGDYQNEVYEDYFLVWNIIEKDILLDKLRNDILEENINKAKIYSNESASDLMKINNGKIFKIERYETFIYIYTDEEPGYEWKLWNIRNIGSIEKYKKLRFIPLGNRQTEDLIVKLKNDNGKRLRSEAEIFERVSSFADIKNLSLEKIKLGTYVENGIEGYDANNVFTETITLIRNKKEILYLYFNATDETNKYLYDELSFILSNIEYFYPEYKVKGVLKWK